MDEDAIFENVTIKEIKQYIDKVKATNSRGDSELTNKMLKVMKMYMAPALTHLTNRILATGIFPAALKNTRILPIKKRGKPQELLDSFRPINNLNPMEKIVEEAIRVRINRHLEKNNIIPRNHHGSREGHSTQTATMGVENILKKNKANNKITAILATDLSSAYDTVDHQILLEKLEHIGLRGKPYSLIESYLCDRKSYCEVHGYCSQLRNMPACSVVQGSKTSGTFFGIYTLEMTSIKPIIESKELTKYIMKEENKELQTTEIESSGYVDDINHLIANKSKDDLEKQTQGIYKLVTKIYTENRLMVNEGKSKILQVEKNTADVEDTGRRMIKIKDSRNKIIQAEGTLKVLGFTLNAKANMENHISKVKSRIGLELSKLKPYLHLMEVKDRKTILNAKLRSIIDYALPLFMGEPESIKAKVESTYMLVNRLIHGKCGYMDAKTKICKDIKVDLPKMWMRKTAATFLHKHLTTAKCHDLILQLKIPKRIASPIFVRDPQLGNYNCSLDRIVEVYNSLPLDLKAKKVMPFKRYLKKHDI